MEERICKVENCTNRVLKKKKKKKTAQKLKDNQSDMKKEEEEEVQHQEQEEEFCKRHAVKKVDEDGHVICS